MFRTFSPASDLETKQIVWSCFQGSKQMKIDSEPQVVDSVTLSGAYANRYSFKK